MGGNVILLKDCRIRESTLYKLTIIVPTKMYLQPHQGGFEGMNWLNERPLEVLQATGNLQHLLDAEKMAILTKEMGASSNQSS